MCWSSGPRLQLSAGSAFIWSQGSTINSANGRHEGRSLNSHHQLLILWCWNILRLSSWAPGLSPCIVSGFYKLHQIHLKGSKDGSYSSLYRLWSIFRTRLTQIQWHVLREKKENWSLPPVRMKNNWSGAERLYFLVFGTKPYDQALDLLRHAFELQRTFSVPT